MTTIRQLVIDAFRESNLSQAGVDPDADLFDEGLRKLQSLVSSLYGNEMGVPLTPVSYGTSGLTNAYGIASDMSPLIDSTIVPENTRLIVNNASASTVYLPPVPYDGARFAVIDNSGNFATNPLTVNGNGRKIESASSVTLNTNSTNKEWFYRQDLGEWVLISALTESSDSPFPSEFDEFLVTLLAMRLNPRFQTQTSPETMQGLQRSRNQFRARYRQTTEVGVDDGLLRLTNYPTYNSWFDNVRFNRGWFF